MLASRHEPGTAREGLIVEAQVWHGPIQVFSGQHFPVVLPVVCNPSGPLVAVSRIQDGGLVSPQLGGLLWKPRNQDCCHTGEILQPRLDVDDCRTDGAAGCVGRVGRGRVIRPHVSPQL